MTPELATFHDNHCQKPSCLLWATLFVMSHPVTNQPAPISILGKVGTKRPPTNDLTPSLPIGSFFVLRLLKLAASPWKGSALLGLSGSWSAVFAVPSLAQPFALNKLSLLKYSVSGNSFPTCARTATITRLLAYCKRRNSGTVRWKMYMGKGLRTAIFSEHASPPNQEAL